MARKHLGLMMAYFLGLNSVYDEAAIASKHVGSGFVMPLAGKADWGACLLLSLQYGSTNQVSYGMLTGADLVSCAWC